MNKNVFKEKVFPLHRSVTDDDGASYNHNNPSPFTRLVSKLLGLKKTEEAKKYRPQHSKSRSTTSITKGSVLLSSSYQTIRPDTPNDNNAIMIPQKRKTAIVFDVPKKEQDETSSISSSSLITISSVDSSLSSLKSITDNSFVLVHKKSSTNIGSSTAVDALTSLASASTKNSFLVDSDTPPIVLQGRKMTTEPVLTENISEKASLQTKRKIRPYLPKRFRVNSNWNLLYSLDQHGVSLSSLYSSTQNYDGPCIMIIKDADKQIYGAYLSHTLKCQNNTYYGTGECFLWKLTEQKKEKTLPTIKVFPWTGKNDYMLLCDTSFIAIGGGDGRFGLWLNSDLEKGHSTTCPTFDNECLALRPHFECMEMEIWGFSI